MRQRDAQLAGSLPGGKRQPVVWPGSDGSEYDPFSRFAKRLQRRVVDNLLARRQNHMNFRRIHNIDPDRPETAIVFFFPNRRQGAFDAVPVKIDALVSWPIRIPVIDTDTAAAGVFDKHGVLEKVFSEQHRAVQHNRYGEMAGGIGNGGVQAMYPFVRHFDRDQRALIDHSLPKGQRCAAVPCVCRNLDFPGRARRGGEGLDVDRAAGQAEHAHAGRVFAARDIIAPARMSQHQQGGWIVDAAAIIADVQKGSAVLFGQIDRDAGGAGASGILEHLMKAVSAVA
ncbi:hypothetical protein ACQKE8_22170 [Sphingobium limneticum]|uniref:hypothetical protein n=1 Tax=Sphingobium limneticum TaxID=1007511 RepID=UPI003D089B63